MLHKVETEDGGWTGNSTLTLLCPKCGGHNLHHGRVTAFSRPEDAGMVRRTVAHSSGAMTELIPNDESGNPSARRGGLTVEFDCENCHGEQPHSELFTLEIWQHKGCTYMVWRTTD